MTPLAKAVRCVAPVEAILGEGPLFDPRIERLLFLDIKGGKIFRYDPQTEKTETFAAPGKVSALGLRRNGGYVCARKDGFAFLDFGVDAVRMTPVAAPETDRPENRFNDGKVDPFGGFWAGTMDEKEKDACAGNWWRLSPDLKAMKIDEGFHVTNGPAFDAARGRVYFTDSARRTVFIARATTSGFEDKRVFLKFDGDEGYPDGMDVDSEGCVWIAFWDGAAVRRFSSGGDLLEVIDMPIPRPTSVALVGDRAYVTSARVGLDASALSAAPTSGGFFEIQLGRDAATSPVYFAG